MSVTYSFGQVAGYTYQNVMNLIATEIYGASITLSNGTQYQLVADGITYEFTGTAFTFTEISGHTYLTGGTVDGISVSNANGLLGALSDMTLLASNMTTAFLAELSGSDPPALEQLFLTQDWTFQGTNGANLLNDTMTSPDNTSLIPSGNNTAHLGAGRDVFQMGDGNDTVYGGAGRDKLRREDGDDVIYGDNGRDKIWGGSGEDMLFGGNGHDVVRGNRGDDFVYGGAGNDRVAGGRDNDTLDGGTGDDILRGGNGSDQFHFRTLDGTDTVEDFIIGDDSLHFELGQTISLSEDPAGTLISHGVGGSVLLSGQFLISSGQEDDLLDQIFFDL